MLSVRVAEQDFSADVENSALLECTEGVGALANFIGVVRQSGQANPLKEMWLEHYPGMTEHTLQNLLERAAGRWPVLAARVHHRVGALQPGEQIVYVGVAAAHRQAAFDACSFIMDFLKTEAPFWKKEIFADGLEQWVAARDNDRKALGKWAK